MTTVAPRAAASLIDRLTGLDLNFNCGLIQSPDNRIRTHLQLHRSKEEGVKATVFELSPRYAWPLGGHLSAGVGPSLAVVRASAPGVSKTLTGLGLAAGLNWTLDSHYVGADLRWHDTRLQERFRVRPHGPGPQGRLQLLRQVQGRSRRLHRRDATAAERPSAVTRSARGCA